MMEFKGVLAPLVQLKAERVKEPEAGIPPSKPQPTFAMPILNISWFASILLPAFAASDLPIEIPSNTQSNAIAKAGP